MIQTNLRNLKKSDKSPSRKKAKKEKKEKKEKKKEKSATPPLRGAPRPPIDEIKKGYTFVKLFDTYNATDLVEYCKKHSIKVAPKKSENIKRILAYLETGAPPEIKKKGRKGKKRAKEETEKSDKSEKSPEKKEKKAPAKKKAKDRR